MSHRAWIVPALLSAAAAVSLATFALNHSQADLHDVAQPPDASITAEAEAAMTGADQGTDQRNSQRSAVDRAASATACGHIQDDSEHRVVSDSAPSPASAAAQPAFATPAPAQPALETSGSVQPATAMYASAKAGSSMPEQRQPDTGAPASAQTALTGSSAPAAASSGSAPALSGSASAASGSASAGTGAASGTGTSAVGSTASKSAGPAGAAAPGGAMTTGSYASQGSMIKITSGAEEIDAYLATPKHAGPHPAVIVIQEWWGLNDQIKSVADAFATKGYVAIAPDLYRGHVTADPKVAMELLNSMPDSRANGDLLSAYKYLRNNGGVQSMPIGSIGFCMGGRLSLLLATAEPKLACCVVCYGRPETDTAKLKNIGAPVLGLYGGADTGIPKTAIDAFKADMTKLGKQVDLKVFPGAGHGFLNPNNPTYNPEAAKEAWPAIDAFLAKNLTHAPGAPPQGKGQPK